MARSDLRERKTPSPTEIEDMPSAPTPSPLVDTASAEERAAAGKVARGKTSRDSHGEWQPRHRRRDPVKVLEDQAKTRVPELVPIRYGRCSRRAGPSAFKRSLLHWDPDTDTVIHDALWIAVYLAIAVRIATPRPGSSS
jgi:hypothetical protein